MRSFTQIYNITNVHFTVWSSMLTLLLFGSVVNICLRGVSMKAWPYHYKFQFQFVFISLFGGLYIEYNLYYIDTTYTTLGVKCLAKTYIASEKNGCLQKYFERLQFVSGSLCDGNNYDWIMVLPQVLLKRRLNSYNVWIVQFQPRKYLSFFFLMLSSPLLRKETNETEP